MQVCSVTSVVSDSLQPHGLQPVRILCPWGFSRQEYWSGLPCPSPEDLPDPAIEPASLTSPALAAASLPLESPKKLPLTCRTSQFCSFFLPCSPLYTCMSCSLSSLRSLLSVTSLLQISLTNKIYPMETRLLHPEIRQNIRKGILTRRFLPIFFWLKG